LPGVEGVAVSGSLPLSGSAFDTLVTINGRVDAPVGGHSVDFDICSPGYFQALGIPLLRGRVFDESDTTKKARVVVINEALARQLFPDQNPLGLSLTEGTNSWEIIGVVGDVRVRRLSRAARPMIYRPYSFAGSGNFHLFVRTATEPLALSDAVRRAILAFDPAQPVAHMRSMEMVLGTSVATPRLIAVLLATFAGTALLLAAIGLYGVISYYVAQRSHEIGVRMALGAARADVLRMVLGQGMTLSLVGLAVGLLASLGLVRVLANLLFQVKPGDPVTFGAVSLLLLIVAGLACWFPARRATKVDPMMALRSE
jgi:predicted permease